MDNVFFSPVFRQIKVKCNCNRTTKPCEIHCAHPLTARMNLHPLGLSLQTEYDSYIAHLLTKQPDGQQKLRDQMEQLSARGPTNPKVLNFEADRLFEMEMEAEDLLRENRRYLERKHWNHHGKKKLIDALNLYIATLRDPSRLLSYLSILGWEEKWITSLGWLKKQTKVGHTPVRGLLEWDDQKPSQCLLSLGRNQTNSSCLLLWFNFCRCCRLQETNLEALVQNRTSSSVVVNSIDCACTHLRKFFRAAQHIFVHPSVAYVTGVQREFQDFCLLYSGELNVTIPAAAQPPKVQLATHVEELHAALLEKLDQIAEIRNDLQTNYVPAKVCNHLEQCVKETEVSSVQFQTKTCLDHISRVTKITECFAVWCNSRTQDNNKLSEYFSGTNTKTDFTERVLRQKYCWNGSPTSTTDRNCRHDGKGCKVRTRKHFQTLPWCTQSTMGKKEHSMSFSAKILTFLTQVFHCRRVWKRINAVKAISRGGQLVFGYDSDSENDEEAKWNWYISWSSRHRSRTLGPSAEKGDLHTVLVRPARL